MGSNPIAKRPELLLDVPFHYCGGCSHGIIHRLLAEVIEQLKIREKVIGVAPVGCSSRIHMYLDIDFVKASHGRALAVATGIRKELPENIIFTYQGDGDLLAIGLSEVMNAAIRGENILTILVNNGIYGMTGGQLAPTSLVGQHTSTTLEGRKITEYGYPIKFPELISSLPKVCFVHRCSVDSPANIRITKRTLKAAFQMQKSNSGFALIEILAICPTNWRMSPTNALCWLRENMIPYFPLGNKKREGGY